MLITWSRKRLRISHFRTKEQDEVDLVLEDRRGRVIGIEVLRGLLHRLRVGVDWQAGVLLVLEVVSFTLKLNRRHHAPLGINGVWA